MIEVPERIKLALQYSYSHPAGNYQSESDGIVNIGKIESRNKLSKVAKPQRTSTKDRFNLTSL